MHIQVKGDPRHPPLVFIHGFLGSGEDWKKVVAQLSDEYYCVTLDLPGHGNSFNISVSCLEQSVILIEKTLSAHAITNYIFIGYSLGARLIAYGAAKRLFTSMQAFVLEGANLGGLTEQERERRLVNDTRWSQRFCSQPLKKVLQKWYQQPVFSSLDERLRSALIDKRYKINSRTGLINKNLGQMLLASSLAKQDDLRAQLQDLAIPKCYFVGEYDTKFCRLSAEYQIPVIKIFHAGHNGHIENPDGFVSALETFITNIEELKIK